MSRWLPGLLILLLAAAPARAETGTIIPVGPDPGPAAADFVPHVRLDRSDVAYTVNEDLTYAETVTLDRTLLTTRGVQSRDRDEITYYPGQQKLTVEEAWVDEPDGTRLQVGADNLFTRPSAASESAPGFTGSLTTTVVYPQLAPGSRIHVKYHREQTTPPLIGFNAWSEAELEDPVVEDRLSIDLPADLPLRWNSRGAVAVTDATEGGRRRIVALMAPSPGAEPERSSVSPSDFQPIFIATTMPDLEAVGALYYRQSQGRAVVTPEIAALAARIAGDRTGLDAARAVYDWVAINIRYIAVYLNPNDGWVPHAAAEVLKNGYGDCKDHTVLMQALLAARGIAAQATLVQWGNRFADLPLGSPYQFNHTMVYLPDYDVYLNPTNPYAPFGSLDRTLSGKQVVIATPGGRIARTPPSTPAANRYVITSRLSLDTDGDISGTAKWSLSSNFDTELRAWLASATSSASLLERVLLGTPEGGFGRFRSTDPRELATPLAVSATWRSPHGVTFRGGEAAITVPAGPDIEPVSRLRRFLSPEATRRTPMLVGARDLGWNTTLTLPPGMSAAGLPPAVAVRTPVGSYTARYEHDGDAITIARRLVIDRDVYQPDEYPALEQLLYAVLDDARATILLTRAEAALRPVAIAR